MRVPGIEAKREVTRTLKTMGRISVALSLLVTLPESCNNHEGDEAVVAVVRTLRIPTSG